MSNHVFNKLRLLYERVGIRPKVGVFVEIPNSEKKCLERLLAFYYIKLLCYGAILSYRPGGEE